MSVHAPLAEAEIAVADEFGQLGRRSQLAANSVRPGDFESVAAGSRNLFNKLFLVLATTCALHFFRQENFSVVIENKIHFFLVAFATDF